MSSNMPLLQLLFLNTLYVVGNSGSRREGNPTPIRSTDIEREKRQLDPTVYKGGGLVHERITVLFNFDYRVLS